jgi:hypothetical protein
MLQCALAIPSKRRTRAIVGAIGSLQHPAYTIPPALELLDHFPSSELVIAILERTARGSDFPGRKDVKRRLRALGERHPFVMQALSEALANDPVPTSLTLAKVFEPRTLGELDDVQKEQLRLAGLSYDGRDLPADARLADDESETTFLGFLEFRTITDDEGRPRYDALLYKIDRGIVFEAGTTNAIGAVVECVVDVPDRALRKALEIVLGPEPDEGQVALSRRSPHVVVVRPASERPPTHPEARAEVGSHANPRG